MEDCIFKNKEFIKAEKLVEDKEIVLALDIFERLNELFPNNCHIELNLATIYIKRKATYFKGMKLFKKLLKTKLASEAMLELGRMELNNHNYKEARSYFTKILQRDQNHLGRRMYAIMHLAEVEMKLLNNDKVDLYVNCLLDMYDELRENDKYQIQLFLGKVYLDKQEIDEARKYLEASANNNVKKGKKALAILESTRGNFDEAIELMKQLLSSELRIDALVWLAYLYIRKEDFKTAYNYYEQLSQYTREELEYCIKGPHVYLLDIYLKCKFNQLTEKDTLKEQAYTAQMIINYDEEKAKKHIQLHLDENENKVQHSIFNPNVSIDEMFEYAKQKICFMTTDSVLDITDAYSIEFEHPIGIADGNETNKIKVITIVNTNNIITMYPISNIEKLKEKKTETIIENQKVLRKTSQIEKFNRRYSIQDKK